MRSKSASDVCTSSWTSRRPPIGKNSLVCSVVKATSVPIVIDCEPRAIEKPANQYTRAGMIAKVIWMEAIIQRPVIRLRTSRSARRRDSPAKRAARSSVRPIVLPSRIPETDSDSWTIDETSASDAWRSAVTFLRCAPTRFVSQTNSGSSASANAARRQSRSSIATIVASTVVTFESTDVAVDVTTVVDPADVVRDPALHLARPRPREERERELLQMSIHLRAQVVHDALTHLVREERLPDADHPGQDRDRDHPGDESAE